ncbi:MAG: hypothetical protein IPK85_02530 [Gemmatimonadetes bacterium]|nr:hypothetical protein [Gemmatimonadota bacterium]
MTGYDFLAGKGEGYRRAWNEAVETIARAAMEARIMDRIDKLGATVWRVPDKGDLPDAIARVARLWAEIHEADRELALELARKLPGMEISRLTKPDHGI